MKSILKLHLNNQSGFVYPFLLFLLMLWMIVILSGIEEIKLEKEQVKLDKEMYELHTLYNMTKRKLSKETAYEPGPLNYQFPNGTAKVWLDRIEEDTAYYHAHLETISDSNAERKIVVRHPFPNK
ncbi:hypothetical protein GGQ92_000546 [Gracilibacillus halotolerans]|uniref:ComG operon protein 7 n=1 Tax=Gracilibacillus halotolerans TaxID=74386 RepID=A0A841RH24_9BACI|nr:hypothetical protein [Gracilibacillus halotolerans]MBB6511779.1 hypothetical protein [Gracilibacillus halotolerans]